MHCGAESTWKRGGCVDDFVVLVEKLKASLLVTLTDLSEVGSPGQGLQNCGRETGIDEPTA